jgi:hypothetical protein
MKVESRALCGAGSHTGWQPASLWRGPVRRLAPLRHRKPQDAILGCHPAPQKASDPAYKGAQMPAVLLLNRASLHFHVARPHDGVRWQPAPAV